MVMKMVSIWQVRSGYIIERGIKPRYQVIDGGLVMGQAQIELGSHGVEKNLTLEQGQHQSPAFFRITFYGGSIVEYRIW
jgi:hypothetical protein